MSIVPALRPEDVCAGQRISVLRALCGQCRHYELAGEYILTEAVFRDGGIVAWKAEPQPEGSAPECTLEVGKDIFTHAVTVVETRLLVVP